jgi:UDP-N-acetylmuramate--alanine ligase
MKYHLIGDQGISMGGIKKYLQNTGHIVSGSDLKTGGHSAENVKADVDVVVRTSAVNPGCDGWVEVEAAKRLGIKVVKRSQLLGELTKDKKVIAISGMHGKTTITSMVGLLLIEAGFDPTVLVGDRLKEFDDDVIRFGKSEWFVMEACEYDRSFLDFKPDILILTNIEEEHLDTYPGGLSEIKETFVQYLHNVSAGGTVIACADDKNVLEVIADSKIKANVIFYGRNAEKYNNIDFEMAIPGKHNLQNAMSILALADCLNIKKEIVVEVLSKFKNAHRRFELKGNYNGADLIDDYGHHPTEIKSTLSAFKERYPDKHRIVVFWPHQYKRIMALLSDFAQSFADADLVIVKPIFFVPGRDEVLDISSSDLVSAINKNTNNAKYFETDEEIVDYLKNILDKDSVLLTIGIPPVYKISEKILEEPHD